MGAPAEPPVPAGLPAEPVVLAVLPEPPVPLEVVPPLPLCGCDCGRVGFWPGLQCCVSLPHTRPWSVHSELLSHFRRQTESRQSSLLRQSEPELQPLKPRQMPLLHSRPPEQSLFE
jgi:hypothetical protein